MSSFKPVARGEIKLKWNTETVSASPAYFSTRRNCFRVLFQGCADSRVRTTLKLKSNKTVDGWLKRSPDRRQFCFISVLFHHVRRALVLQERMLVYDRRWLAAALYHNTLQSDHRRRISASDNSVSSAWSTTQRCTLDGFEFGIFEAYRSSAMNRQVVRRLWRLSEACDAFALPVCSAASSVFDTWT